MVDVAAGCVARAPTKAWMTMAVLLLLGMVSFAAVADQANQRRDCGPIEFGRSALGGCDWLR
jgi:hypothetical protein